METKGLRVIKVMMTIINVIVLVSLDYTFNIVTAGDAASSLSKNI